MHSNDPVLCYRYRFMYGGGNEVAFDIELEPESLSQVQQERGWHPNWTALNWQQCPNCPLRVDEHPQCPVAVSLIDVVSFFGEAVSFEEVDVIIETDIREYRKHTTLQTAISSLLGLLMVTCGCPILEKLKPMVMSHLPFATPEETAYRAISMYLLAQYFLLRRGKTPDWELKDLMNIYDEIRIVNRSLVRRLSLAGVQDASVNAVIVLDTFANFVTYPGDENILAHLEPMFRPYLG